jgi:hypothetical protein
MDAGIEIIPDRKATFHDLPAIRRNRASSLPARSADGLMAQLTLRRRVLLKGNTGGGGLHWLEVVD